MHYGRSVIFIDNSNIFKNMNNIGHGYRIDWIKLINWFETEFGLEAWDQWFFVSELDEPRESQTKFYDMLRDAGFHLVISYLRKKSIHCPECENINNTYIEKGVDVSIATHMLRLLYNNAFDTAILISGDSDLCGAVEEVKHNGRKVIVVSFRDALSNDLQKLANAVVYLDDIAHLVKLERERTLNESNNI